MNIRPTDAEGNTTEEVKPKRSKVKPARRMTRWDGEIEGHPVRIEMREDGIHAWRLKTRKNRKKVSFAEFWSMAQGQALLNL